MVKCRRAVDSLAIAWNPVENDRHEPAYAIEIEAALRACGRPELEHAHRADVHVGAAIFDAEKHRVESGKAFVMRRRRHVGSPHTQHRACQRIRLDHAESRLGVASRPSGRFPHIGTRLGDESRRSPPPVALTRPHPSA
jgi:hypothetical protein